MIQQISIAPVLQVPQAPQGVSQPAQAESFQSVMKKAISEKDSTPKADGKPENPKQQKETEGSVVPPDAAVISSALCTAGLNAAQVVVQNLQAASAGQAKPIAEGTVIAAQPAAPVPAQPVQAAPVSAQHPLSPAGTEGKASAALQQTAPAKPAAAAAANEFAPAAAAQTAQTPLPLPKAENAPKQAEAGANLPALQTEAAAVQTAEAPPVQGQKTAIPAAPEKAVPVQVQKADAESFMPAVQKGTAENDPSQQSAAQGAYQQLFQTGNVVIKISDAPSETPKAVSHQVADQVSLHYKAGNPQFEMQLYPKNLGRVTVKLGVEKGTLTVEIFAANPKTQSMLLSGSGEIRSMIESTVHQPVQVQQPAQNAEGHQQQSNEGQSRQQQQRQQAESRRQPDPQDTASTTDFVTFMQQLRAKVYSV